MARRPYIPNSSYYKLTIPELSGGVNLRDNISLIHDNQLTDCENVWYKDGMLRTRAALKTTPFNDLKIKINRLAMQYGEQLVYMSEKNIRIVDGFVYFLAVLKTSQLVYVRYLSYDNTERPIIEVAKIEDMPSKTLNVFQKGGEIYIFGSVDDTVSLESGLPIYKIWEENGEWKSKRIQMSDTYIPTIMANCSTGYIDNMGSTYGVSMLEGYNLLSNRYKMYFNNAKEYQSPQSGTVTQDALVLSLLEDVSEYVGEKVTVEITHIDGKVATHEATITNGASYEDGYNAVDGYKMTISGKFITFADIQGNNPHIYRSQFMQNCIVVEAPCKHSVEDLKKVLNCTFNEWFGGGSEGLYGGIHLFFGGNTEEKHKALVLWSDINKPLYFSENCCAYVGDKMQKVTAFGKQGEALIIAKEREMYATQYVNNSEAITEEAVPNQAVVDITTDVIFPMTQVHGFIGCDCPNTMQLCRNRLVWANSNGKVYSLVSANQYSERTIYEVSGMVDRRLKEFAREDLQTAYSADWQGRYVLMINSTVFLMDYNSYGFSNVYSYSKTEDAQSNIPWWIWNIDFPEFIKVKAIANIEEKLFFSAVIQTGMKEGYYEFLYFDGEGNEDVFPKIQLTAPESGGMAEDQRYEVSREISTMIKTKCYDFGSPTILKNIPKIELTLGTNGGAAINTTAITDKGESDTVIYVDAPEKDRYSVGHFENKLIRPLANRANRLLLKFTCDGDMAIDSMTIIYKMLGGVKQ